MRRRDYVQAIAAQLPAQARTAKCGECGAECVVKGHRLPEIKPKILSVTDGTTCVGFVLARGRDGFEAFNRHGKTMGKFKTQNEATRAIPRIEEAAR